MQFLPVLHKQNEQAKINHFGQFSPSSSELLGSATQDNNMSLITHTTYVKSKYFKSIAQVA